MTHALPAVLLASLAVLPSAGPQDKPDFSGTWTMDAARSESPVQNEPIKAITVVIAQSSSEIVIDTTRDGRSQKVTYRPGNPGSMTPISGRTGLLGAIWYWQGDRLVTETLSDVNGMTMRTKGTYALQAGGAELTIESLLVVEHGYSIRGGRNYGTVTDVFKRNTP
jgi:hypothetical protein